MERPILEHLHAYETYLNDRGDGSKYVRTTVRNILRCVIDCRLEAVDDLAQSERIRRWLRDERKRCNHSAATFSHRVTTLRSFAKWLECEGLIARNPLLGIQRINPATDRRLERRAATHAEITALLTSTRASKRTIRRLDGAARAWLYHAAMLTGFRAQELASLVRDSFTFDATEPTVRLAAASSKHRKVDVLPLPLAFAAGLERWTRGRERLWVGSWYLHAAEMLRCDLKAAGIAFRDGSGRVLDFHALRHTFVTAVVRSGANVRVAQQLARHANVHLTLSVYTHVDLDEMRAAVERVAAGMA